MSKITFRADDELIDELEAFDASKSEVMRQALRTYLDENANTAVNAAQTDVNAGDADDSLDAMLAERIDAMLAERLDGVRRPREPQDVNVNITLDGDSATVEDGADHARKTGAEGASNAPDERTTSCGQCGENVGSDHVYCPNCGEKTSRRVFCDCGDELRSDWAFCPSCGRRTPAADVLDSR